MSWCIGNAAWGDHTSIAARGVRLVACTLVVSHAVGFGIAVVGCKLGLQVARGGLQSSTNEWRRDFQSKVQQSRKNVNSARKESYPREKCKTAGNKTVEKNRGGTCRRNWLFLKEANVSQTTSWFTDIARNINVHACAHEWS